MINQIETVEYQNKVITLIGTSHVSRESVSVVEKTIEDIAPDSICVELDEERYKALKKPHEWENTNIIDVIKTKKVGFLLANLILSSYQKNLAKSFNTMPGQEMYQGIKCAEKTQCELVLADRSIQTTFLRIWKRLSLLNKIRLFFAFFSNYDESESVSGLEKNESMETALDILEKDFPELASVLLDERNQYLAHNIRNATGSKIVAVLGAAHVDGVKNEIFRKQDIIELDSIPESSKLSKFLKWTIIIALLLIMASGFIINIQTGLKQIQTWFLWNGFFAALFTFMMFGHPLSILTAFVVAPFTSICPFLACGWFVGLVEATLRKPTVEDLNNVPEDIVHLKSFLKNRFLKALAIVIFTNIGSTVGTIVAGTSIIKYLF